jgi:hypothetical protein
MKSKERLASCVCNLMLFSRSNRKRLTLAKPYLPRASHIIIEHLCLLVAQLVKGEPRSDTGYRRRPLRESCTHQ